MIIGLDHLSWSVTDTDAAVNTLVAKGYQCVFLERGVPNSPHKSNLLASISPTHDIGVFKSKEGKISIELTNHGVINEAIMSPYLPDEDGVFLHTHDIELEKEFWTVAMRFKRTSVPNLLALTSPIPNWGCKLTLVHATRAQPPTLDSKGYPCLAFISNNIDVDSVTIKNAGGYDWTERFSSVFNQKQLLIRLFRSPTGALCELIQFRSQNG